MRGQAVQELSTSAAARLYETHPNVLNRLILIGRLEARKNTSGNWQISKKSLDAWHTERMRRKSGGESVTVAHAVRALAGQNRKRSKNPAARGSAAENVRQPRDGERIEALRPTENANRPSNDSWRVNTEEPAKR